MSMALNERKNNFPMEEKKKKVNLGFPCDTPEKKSI